MQDTGYRIPDTRSLHCKFFAVLYKGKYRMQDTGYKMPDTRSLHRKKTEVFYNGKNLYPGSCI